MIDMGEILPRTELGPIRQPDGVTLLGRPTTTEEQRMEAVDKMTAYMTGHSNRGRDLRATVRWGSGDATVLEVRFAEEHIDGMPVFLPDRITEYTATGAEIPANEDARLRTLQAELADMHERGML